MSATLGTSACEAALEADSGAAAGAEGGVSSPRVTLGIAAYNGERFLAEAIESCLAQDYADFELLIVDDASTDSTPAVIARYASDPRVRVVTHAREPRHRRRVQLDRRARPRRADRTPRPRRHRAPRPAQPRGGRLRRASRHGGRARRRGHDRRLRPRRGRVALGRVRPRGADAHAGAAPQLPGRPDDHDPPARVRRGGRLRRGLPDVQRLRPVAAGGPQVPLSPLWRRAADPLPPPRRELLGRVGQGREVDEVSRRARGRRRARGLGDARTGGRFAGGGARAAGRRARTPGPPPAAARRPPAQKTACAVAAGSS